VTACLFHQLPFGGAWNHALLLGKAGDRPGLISSFPSSCAGSEGFSYLQKKIFIETKIINFFLLILS